MRRLFGCPDIVSLTEKFLMARNFFWIFTENNPVMGYSKTFFIPEAKGLMTSGCLIIGKPILLLTSILNWLNPAIMNAAPPSNIPTVIRWRGLKGILSLRMMGYMTVSVSGMKMIIRTGFKACIWSGLIRIEPCGEKNTSLRIVMGGWLNLRFQLC